MERNFLIYQAANDAALQVSSFMFVFFIHGHGSKKEKFPVVTIGSSVSSKVVNATHPVVSVCALTTPTKFGHVVVLSFEVDYAVTRRDHRPKNSKGRHSSKSSQCRGWRGAVRPLRVE